MAYSLLHWFYLASLGGLSVALLFQTPLAALALFVIVTVWLGTERYRNRNDHQAGWGTTRFHYRLLALSSKLDVFVNRISRGSLLGESGRAHISRICVAHRGAKTGRNRIVPIMRYRINNFGVMGSYGEVVAGSYNGAERHPAWVHNFRAAQRNSEEVVYNKGASIYCATVREVTDPAERRELLCEMHRANPGLEEKQSRTRRTIPVFILHPTGEWRWEYAPDRLVMRLTPDSGWLGRRLIAIADWF